ncbi:hypothetical protein CUMW_053450 [Citrus unshiu]|nr:hypothetical protein CUMW_053450 [Citrus unshiu]
MGQENSVEFKPFMCLVVILKNSRVILKQLVFGSVILVGKCCDICTRKLEQLLILLHMRSGSNSLEGVSAGFSTPSETVFNELMLLHLSCTLHGEIPTWLDYSIGLPDTSLSVILVSSTSSSILYTISKGN